MMRYCRVAIYYSRAEMNWPAVAKPVSPYYKGVTIAVYAHCPFFRNQLQECRGRVDRTWNWINFFLYCVRSSYATLLSSPYACPRGSTNYPSAQQELMCSCYFIISFISFMLSCLCPSYPCILFLPLLHAFLIPYLNRYIILIPTTKKEKIINLRKDEDYYT